MNDFMFGAGLYLVCCYGVGEWAQKRGKNIFTWGIASFFVTPVVTACILLYQGKKGQPAPEAAPVNRLTQPAEPVMTDPEKVEAPEITKIRGLLRQDKKTDARAALEKYVKGIIQNRGKTLTEEECRDIFKLDAALGAALDDGCKNALQNRYALTAFLKTNRLPRPFTGCVTANFRRGETVYYCDTGVLRKWKTTTRRLGYAGPHLSIPIVKGLRYRAGSFSPIVNKETVLEMADTGTLCITNQRIFFAGKKENFSIPLNRIFQMGASDEGLLIQKENTVTPKIVTMLDYDLPLAILSALINEESVSLTGETQGKAGAEVPEGEGSAGGETGAKKRRKRRAGKTGPTLDDLPKLKKLLDDGIITEEEFDEAKKKALGS